MYNKVIVIGRLTATPELHKTANEKSVARATVAVNRRYKSQSGEREADFVNVVVWGRLAETLASYASKGSLILWMVSCGLVAMRRRGRLIM